MKLLPFLFLSTGFCEDPVVRDTREQPLTPHDAVRRIERVCGRVVVVLDANGDGVKDIVVARGAIHGLVETLDLVSAKDGALIRVICPALPVMRSDRDWDAGGDIDADGQPDVLFALSDDAERRGAVRVVSGKDGSTKYELRGSSKNELLGASLAWIGDVNGDGADDFALGATEIDPTVPLVAGRIVGHWMSQTGNDLPVNTLVSADGTEREQRSLWRERMSLRSKLPGFVSLRSGRDGAELWRSRGAIAGHAFGQHVRRTDDLDADGGSDVLAQCDLRSDEPIALLSGKNGERIATLPHRLGFAGSVGDVDGVGDLYLDNQDGNFIGRSGRARFVSGKTRKELFQLRYPDGWSEYAVTVGVGDLDGDGIGDLAIGDANFNVCAKGDPRADPDAIHDLANMDIDDAFEIESAPWCAFTWESGCVHVYSGRTRAPLMGVWAEPSTREGLGLNVAALPDVTGDGHPDLLVTNANTAFVFAGPGPEKK